MGADHMGVNTKTNRELLAIKLKKAAEETNSRLWADIANRIRRPKDRLSEVNVGHISRFAKGGEAVVVPGIVLGSGRVEEPIEVAALYFTKTAKSKIEEAGGKVMTIEEMLQKKVKASKIKIIG
ncbi:MAG: 50S ribosomal protein L18e [Thermoplasmatales archaeon]